MDFFSRDDLRTLLANRQPPCVSMYMRTTRGVAHEDKTRWKNQVREAEERLVAAGQRAPKANEFLNSARELLEDAPFWLNVSAGLAAFLSPELVRTYRVPLPLDDLVLVADRFHVKPLLPLLAGNGRFFVLALSQNHVRLLQGTHYTAQQIDLQGVPTSLREALLHGDQVGMSTFHTRTTAGGPVGRREAVVHGQGVDVEGTKESILEYFQGVDRGLHRYLREEQAPLVPAAADFLLPIYRLANTYPHLLDEGLEGNPDRLSAHELHNRAWVLVQPHLQRTQEKIAALYRQLTGTGRTSNDVAAVVAAAYQGQIQYLFVALDQEQWGTFDPAALKAQVHDAAQKGDEDLVNLAAVHTLAHKGTVYPVELDQMPEHTPLAAIFWLPLGERSSKRTV
ncbi:MAG: hypothetical protein L0Z62_12295 [Gemmataceae bacterium]|nr:hypothetical protein [Gemmataceae bacterium]